MTAIVWFTRDLRLRDHPALTAALAAHEQVLPVFCLDDRLLHGASASGNRVAFMLECLADLDSSLRAAGGRLILRHGPPERELLALAVANGVTEVHLSGDVSPYARRRLKSVRAAVAEAGATIQEHPGASVLSDVSSLRTTTGGPYTTFTPFWRAWLRAPRRAVLPASRGVPVPGRVLGGGSLEGLPSLRSLGLSEVSPARAHGGERQATGRLSHFLDGALGGYEGSKDALAQEGTSRLSPHLRFGCLSPLEAEQAAQERAAEAGARAGEAAHACAGEVAHACAGEAARALAGAEAFARQLCWRDFMRHLLHHFPETLKVELQLRYRGTLDFLNDEQALAAWRQGRTGYPLVDAGMRQLAKEGWMHNRARLVAGSFLTKHLGIDWREGERWFMSMLIDGDPASNAGNWQWIASVGADRQPISRRVLSPSRQQARFDPGGEYVRRYVPELSGVPARLLSEPWQMTAEQQRSSGCMMGVDYPLPIVATKQARQEALRRYAQAAEGSVRRPARRREARDGR